MEFVSELSEIAYVNHFKWKIIMMPITKELNDSEDMFKYTIRSEIMNFSEVDAKWSLNITEIPSFEFARDDNTCNNAARYFKADFKVIPNEYSLNEIFSFELRVKNVRQYERFGEHHPHGWMDQIKFKLPSVETCIKLEAFCRVRTMVTNTTRQYPDESCYEDAFGQDFSDQESFYESLIEDPVEERNLERVGIDDQERNNNDLLFIDNNESNNLPEDDFDLLEDSEDYVPANQGSAEILQSPDYLLERACNDIITSSDNSSWEKIEESSQEEIFEQQQDTSVSSNSMTKSEAGTDISCLESIPDEKEGVQEKSQRLYPVLIDELLISGSTCENERSGADLLKLPFFSKSNATLTENILLSESNFETDIVPDRINGKLCFNDIDPEMTGGVAAEQPLVVLAEVHQSASDTTADRDVPEINCNLEEADVFNFKEFEDEIERDFQKMYSSRSSSESSVQVAGTENTQVEEDEGKIQEPNSSSLLNDRSSMKSINFAIDAETANDDKDDQPAEDDSVKKEESLITCLPYDQLKKEADNLTKLFIFGTKMKFSHLMADCCLQLSKLITPNNLMEVWNVAEELKNEQLKERVVDYIVQNRYNGEISQDLLGRVQAVINAQEYL